MKKNYAWVSKLFSAKINFNSTFQEPFEVYLSSYQRNVSLLFQALGYIVLTS